MDRETEQTVLPYRHTQIGYVTLVGLGIGFAAQLGGAVRDVRRRRRWAWVSVPRTVVLGVALGLFSTLRVTVDDRSVTAGFNGGLLSHRVALDEVEAVAVVSVPWHRGWGIRKTAAGWMYNVSGRRAVELTLPGGRTFTIGSDEPDALLAAIERARAGRAAAA
jgi:hypothetical protein